MMSPQQQPSFHLICFLFHLGHDLLERIVRQSHSAAADHQKKCLLRIALKRLLYQAHPERMTHQYEYPTLSSYGLLFYVMGQTLRSLGLSLLDCPPLGKWTEFFGVTPRKT